MKKLTLALLLLTLGLMPTFAQTLTDSLVGLYHFNGNADDASSRNNHGSATNTTNALDRNGNSNAAMQFGNGAYVSIPATDLFNDEYSYSLWFYLSNQVANNSKNMLITVGGTTCDQGLAITNNYFGYTGINGGGYYSTSNTYGTAYTTLPQTKKWYHVAQVKSNDSVKLFVNGVLEDSKPASQKPCYSGSNPSGRIGARLDNTQYFPGTIDEVRIYKRALSNSEIQTLYNNELTSLEMVSLPTPEFNIYPNPASKSFFIESANAAVDKVILYDFTGKVLKTLQHTQEVTLENLMPGTYLVELYSGENIVRKTLIIQ
jgi:hypothetical protein